MHAKDKAPEHKVVAKQYLSPAHLYQVIQQRQCKRSVFVLFKIGNKVQS
jgi:hypothetical protein